MTKSNVSAFVAILICGQMATAEARQPSSDRPTWSGSEKSNQASLVFMTPGSDEAELTFDCRVKSGTVHFFVGETSPLKPNVSLSGSFTIARTTSAFTGRTVANEMSGTSSFKGDIQSEAAIFAELTGDRDLEIRIGKSFQKLPLKTAKDQAIKFAARCRK